MPNLVKISMDPLSVDKIFKGHQICLLSESQQCFVGDILPLTSDGNTRYFKIIDIWLVPKDFALKFLWRMCGVNDSKKLNEEFGIMEERGINVDMIFAHIYAQISAFDEIQNLVKL